MKKLYTLALIVMMFSVFFAGSKRDLNMRKMKVKSPYTDFTDMFKSFDINNFKAFVSNYYWTLISPTIAGLASGFG